MDEWIEAHFTRTAFRLEVLPQYTVPSDADNVADYLSGRAGPTWAQGGPWFDHLAAERASGKRRYRVRIVAEPTPYIRYECEWGYVYTTAAGEEVYVLDPGEAVIPAHPLVDHDWWLLDDRHVLDMTYDSAGQFVGARPLEESEAGPYIACRDAVLAAARPFAEYWRDHPELRRAATAGDP
ncbi:DUF6879 family protein [Acrocarpospora phusangensis]